MQLFRPGLVVIGLFFSIYAGVTWFTGPETTLYEARWVFYTYVILGMAIWLYSLFVLLALIWRYPEQIRRYILFYDTWIGCLFIVFWIPWFIPHLATLKWQVDPGDL